MVRTRPSQNDSPRFVSYLRVSTQQQGRSGLGLEAQRDAIDKHIRHAGGTLLAEHIEVESGKKNDRPELTKALAAARATRSTLVIAKLDRLSRNAHFLIGLRDSNVEIVICDMPNADRLTVGIMALVAEKEREMISERTKVALAAAKARGVKLGNPHLKAGDKRTAALATAERSRQARAKAREIIPYIRAAEKAGCKTLQEKADALTARGVKTPNGGNTWAPEQVRRIEKAAATLG
jgi:DNA invertase Pin-like site-specific DNA recombinase